MQVAVTQVRAQIEAFVVKEFLDGDGRGLTATSDLIHMGLIDSISIVTLVEFCRSHFGVDVPTSELVPGNLRNVETLSSLVMRLTQKT